MSTQIQRRRGTTAEHSTFTGADGELTVDTTKDTVVVHDATTVGGHPLQKQYPPLGSAAAPTYTFTGDPNTGIYSPGANQVAVATNGVGRLFVDASGNVGINSPAPTTQNASGYREFLIKGGSTNRTGILRLQDGDGLDTLLLFANEVNGVELRQQLARPITFWTNATEKLRITSAGLVGIGTSSPNPGSKLHVVGDILITGTNARFNAGIDGSASNPTFVVNDGDTGMYRAGANALGFTTGGTAAVTIDSSQRVGIGTTSPTRQLHIHNDTAAYLQLTTSGSISGASGGFQLIHNGAGDLRANLVQRENAPMTFSTNDTERVRIDSSGRVGIGTSSPSNKLHVSGDYIAVDNGYGLTTIGGLKYIADSDDNAPATGALHNFFTDNGTTSALVIQKNGNVGIGTASPAFSNGEGLEIEKSGTACLRIESVSGSKAAEIYVDSTGTVIDSRGANARTNFAIGGSGKMLLDNSGRLLVGTSTAAASGTYSRYALIRTQGNTTSATSWGSINIARGQAATAPISVNSDIGAISFSESTGQEFATIRCVADGTSGASDYPGRLVFSTTADGASSPTERLRIDSSGRLLVGTTTATAQNVFASAVNSSNTFQILQNGGAFVNNIMYLNQEGTGGTGFNFLTCFSSVARLIIGGTGDVTNSNNSYGSISDIKLKENIVDATPQWSDIKALQVRKYNFKEETGHPTHTQIGLVAQEVELVSPGLVSESPDRDAEGNDLGTVTKGVNYSVLYMKAVKALQEAMERIETLEGMVAVNNITIDEQQHQLSTLAARLTALESA